MCHFRLRHLSMRHPGQEMFIFPQTQWSVLRIRRMPRNLQTNSKTALFDLRSWWKSWHGRLDAQRGRENHPKAAEADLQSVRDRSANIRPPALPAHFARGCADRDLQTAQGRTEGGRLWPYQGQGWHVLPWLQGRNVQPPHSPGTGVVLAVQALRAGVLILPQAPEVGTAVPGGKLGILIFLNYQSGK